MKQRGLFVVVAVVMALLIAGCGGQATPQPASAPAEESSSQEESSSASSEAAEAPADAPEAIEIGAVVPLTGPFAGGGAQVERGYKMAVEAINADGGVYVKEYDAKIPLNLTVLDDESDPSKTVSHLETLYSDNDVVAYLGGFGSSLHARGVSHRRKEPGSLSGGSLCPMAGPSARLQIPVLPVY